MDSPRPTLVVAALAITIPLLACREGARPPSPEGATSPEPAVVEPAPAMPPADPEPTAPEPQRVGDNGGFEVRFGLAVTGDGDVSPPVLSFAAGDPVCVSVRRLDGAPASNLEVAWFDDDGNELGNASGGFGGSPPRAALCLPGAERLSRRTYRLDFAVDGTEAGSVQFAVADLRQRDATGGA